MSARQFSIIMSVALLAVSSSATFAANKPLKVFILVGQSNMQGQAKVTTLAGLAMDPETKPLHDKLVDENGKPRVLENVYIAAFSGDGGNKGKPISNTEKHGKLTVGYGGNTEDAEKLGPELGFGVTMYENLKEPILLIKTSWGGKSLLVDFRPPSAGTAPLPADKVEKLKAENKLEEELTVQKEKSGRYYRMMVEHVKKVLADPRKYCPAYDPKAGYEIAGFAWFQGFNDLVGPYPPIDPNGGRKAGKDYSEYGRLLAGFIRDVRKDLSVPNLPFAIGVLGVGGKSPGENTMLFRKAMAAPAGMDEFKGTVKAVNTADFWDEKLGELDVRGSLTSPKGARHVQQGKYADLRKKLAPLQAEYEAASGKDARAKREELKKKMTDIIYTPEEQEYLRRNKSNAGYHYLGSAKTYSQIGKALAEALIGLGKETLK
ncbi:sialate O-acetylesterase [Verrucomicrobiota bacterium]|nr:sialate O-acetylesterase [Verrucomicrobiota bacterium]